MTSARRVPRKRLDELLVERGIFETRARAQAAIMAGIVLVAGRPALKAGQPCAMDCDLSLREPDHPYVSRGGVKLAGALHSLHLDVTGMICGDIGTSTGGFLDCLLRCGARHVYAVDTGNELAHRLRGDSRITYLSDTNARYLKPDSFENAIDLFTVDVSFISVTKIVPALLPSLAPHGRLLVLVKPQFEAGRGCVGRGGIVRDVEIIRSVLRTTCAFAKGQGLAIQGMCESSITGARGNREFFLLLGSESTPDDVLDPDERIDVVLAAS